MENKELKRLTEAFYRGKISQSEEELLYRLIQSDKHAGKWFNDYEKEYAGTGYVDNATAKNWHRFHRNYIQRSRIPFIKKKILYLSRYAAIIAFTFILTYFAGYIKDNFINSEKQAKWCEVIVPKGEKSQIALPDGTHIWLNSETRLRYPDNFTRNKRKVILQGEAFFHVTHQKNSTFFVETNDYTIKVLGTQFNVMAYPDFGRTETSLTEGSVVIEKMSKGKLREITRLKPGEKIVYYKETVKFTVQETNIRLDNAWKDNRFVFEDIPFKELAIRLERWYDVSIELMDPDLGELKYTGKFNNEETIWQVLDIIKTTTPIDYKLKNRKLTITKSK